MSTSKKFHHTIVVAAALALVSVFGLILNGAPASAETPAYTPEAFLSATLRNCLETQGREPRVCECEQKLVGGDRLTEDDKQMAYYYWVDKKEYGKRFVAKKAADPQWQPGFAQRFTNLQALIMSACGN